MLTTIAVAALSGLPTEILGHYFGRVADFLGTELTSDLDWKVWKAKHGLAHNNSDFTERYAEALLSLRSAGKPKPLLKFFANESVFAVIHDYWYGEASAESFEKDFASLTRHFTLDKQLEGFSAQLEIAYFLTFYRKTVNLNRTAGEREVFEILLKILQEVRAEKSRYRPTYEGLIDRIDPNFLQEQKEKTGPLLTPEGFYLANGPAQWWGVMNGLVAPKTLYHGLPQRVEKAFYGSAPVLAIFDGSGGMGKTTAARLLVTELCERYECWWVDELGGDELDLAMPEFLESRIQSGRETLVVLDDWGKYSEDCRRTLSQFMRRQLKKGDATNIRFIVTAKHDEHADLSHDHVLLAQNAELSFDAAEYLKTDNENLLKLALSQLPEEMKGLYETLFNPEDRLLGKPFHLLFILLRASKDPELRQRLTQHNAEGKFKQVLQYDFDRLYRDDEHQGLAVAMLFFAYVKHKHSFSLPYEAFLALANRYATGKTSPGKRLAAQVPEQWHIISHYLTKGKREVNKRLDTSVFIQFKKDEYPNYLLQINLEVGRSTIEYLDQEKNLMVQFLIENGRSLVASQLAYIFSRKEHLLSAQEQIATVEALLNRGVGHHSYTSIFLGTGSLPDVPFEQKWKWIKQFNEISQKNGYFHKFFVAFIKQAQKEAWFEYLNALITLGADSSAIWIPFLNNAPTEMRNLETKRLLRVENQVPDVICRCLDLLREEAKEDARRLLRVENQVPAVICRCLDLLREEAKEDARRLFRVENQNFDVICRCLDLLREEAKEDARRLLRVENQVPDVICRCLGLLHEEAKEDARRLLRVENQVPDVICRCLDLLHEEAKEDARRLLRVENQVPDVICRCLDLLRDEAKEDARTLLKVESQNTQVICRCLDLLRDEAKEEARTLLNVETPNSDVICRCLDLLRDEAKDDARRLLKVENQDKDIICRCLDLLCDEAKEEARNLLKVENQNPGVICRCLQILKTQDPDWAEAREYCLTILQNWQKHPHALVSNCLNYLPQDNVSINVMKAVLREKYQYPFLYASIMHYKYGQHDFWEKEVRRVACNWLKENRMVVGSCLIHLESDLNFVLAPCRQILQRWEWECINTKKALAQRKRVSDRYIQKALAHPQLRSLSAATAQAMYAREQAEPGFLLYYTCEIVVGIVEQGVWPTWESAGVVEVEE